MPDISVIMSVYNGEAYLEEAIESVINQSFKSWELIVINDCSNDSTGTILEDYSNKDERIKVYTNEVNLKLPASLNKAISLCKGKYIARMDADDISLPERFEKQYAFMEANKDVVLSSCRFLTVKNGIYASGGAGGRCDSNALKAMLLVSNPILHPGVIAKAEILKSYQYDTSLTCTEDLELWTRLAADNKKLAILSEPLLIYRLHDKQITSTTLERQHTEVLKIQQKYYSVVLDSLNENIQDFYISGIYFKENADIKEFIKYAKWMKKVSKGKFNKYDINYALIEILAEYKRCGISAIEILKGMLLFNPVFLIKEIVRRKINAGKDISKCFALAKASGLIRTAGTKEFPIFEKQKASAE